MFLCQLPQMEHFSVDTALNMSKYDFYVYYLMLVA
jgi:hypothetical protein